MCINEKHDCAPPSILRKFILFAHKCHAAFCIKFSIYNVFHIERRTKSSSHVWWTRRR